ncbi:hypothetical protein [Comamonas sp. A7-5]|uniref:hypothetical protein n=1 Tax=Comamonas sp. A7-5 TaxID=673549 RepID=UPI0031D910AD
MSKTQLARGIYAGFAPTEDPFAGPNGMEANLRLIDDHLALYTLAGPVPAATALPTDARQGAGQIFTNGTYAVLNAGVWQTYPSRMGMRAIELDNKTEYINIGTGWQVVTQKNEKSYLTRAIMLADTAQPAGSQGVVTNDPAHTAENPINGVYTWTGAAWVRNAFQPANQRDVDDLRAEANQISSRTDALSDALEARAPLDSPTMVLIETDEAGRVMRSVDVHGLTYIDRPDDPQPAPVEKDMVLVETDEAGNSFRLVDVNGMTHIQRPEDPFDAPTESEHIVATYAAGGHAIAHLLADGVIKFELPPLGLGDPGNVASEDPVSSVDVANGNVYMTDGKGRVLVYDGSTYPAISAAPLSSRRWIGTVERSANGSHQAVIGNDSGVVSPADRRLLRHMIGLGQSLRVGSQSATSMLSTVATYPENVLMFAGGAAMDVRMGLVTQDGSGAPALDPATLTGFQPLIAKVGAGSGSRGETIDNAMANALHALASSETGVHVNYLLSTAAMGGTAYAGLKKGTQTYTNTLLAIARAKELAEAAGYVYEFAGFTLQHGEADTANAAYFDNLIEWRSDYDADIKAITGQVADVHFWMSQSSTFNDGRTAAALAFLRAHVESPHHTLIGPQYGVEYYTDYLHCTGPGYYAIGQRFAVAVGHELHGSGGKWEPLRPLSCVLTGNVIDLTFTQMCGPLVLDDVTVANPGNYGFKYTDSISSAQISSVEITSDYAMRILLTQAPTGSNKVLSYGLSGHIGDRNPSTAPRGCIRANPIASPIELSIPNYHWLCHFSQQL